jgi:hypothetical protein
MMYMASSMGSCSERSYTDGHLLIMTDHDESSGDAKLAILMASVIHQDNAGVMIPLIM